MEQRPSLGCSQDEERLQQDDDNGNKDVSVNCQNFNNDIKFATVEQSEEEMVEMEQMTTRMGLMTGSNLQHVSSGVWSCVSYYNQQEQLEEGSIEAYEVGASAASWENNAGTESDYYDDSDFNGSSDVDGGDPENEEVEESCEEDDSLISEVIDDLQVKFELLVGETIGEAEKFLDDANLLKRLAAHTKSSSHFQLCNEAMLDEKPLVEQVQSGSSLQMTTNTLISNNVETQTDFDYAYLTRSSGTLVPSTNENPVEDLTAEQAQLEMGELHTLKDSFLAELKTLTAVASQGRDRKDESPDEKRKLCQIKESMDAIDKALEFKSEVLGAGAMSTVPPDDHIEFPELVTQLEQLSISDLQRLVGVYFNKAVELRYSSEELEKNLERASKKHDDLNRRYMREKKHTRELQEQHQSRILEFLCRNADSSYYSKFRRKEEQLQTARKRQHDLEQSLTVLLVRHGYLLDGVDYDVKQVVRTLGIDESQLAAGSTMNTVKGRVTRRGAISDAVEHVAPDTDLTVAGASAAYFPQSQESPHENPPPRRDRENGKSDTSKLKPGRTLGFDPRNHVFPFVTPTTSALASSSATQVVTRQKGRIIIQPNQPNIPSSSTQGAPGGGQSGGAGSSRHRNTSRR